MNPTKISKAKMIICRINNANSKGKGFWKMINTIFKIKFIIVNKMNEMSSGN